MTVATMSAVFKGDNSMNHIVCRCGYCITCGDCLEYGCGKEESYELEEKGERSNTNGIAYTGNTFIC